MVLPLNQLFQFLDFHFFHFISCRVVALESQLVRTGSLGSEEGHDLYILAGHEASY